MIVHLGVVILVVGYIASSTFQTSREVLLTPGQKITIEGHTLEYLRSSTTVNDRYSSVAAYIRVDGGKEYAPSLRQFPNDAQTIGTPSVRTTPVDDVYLSLLTAPSNGDAVNVRADHRAARGVDVDRRRRDGLRCGAGRVAAASAEPARPRFGSGTDSS